MVWVECILPLRQLQQFQHGYLWHRGRQKSMLVDFEALGAAPKDKLRQAKAASICLKTAPSKADTLLPEDHHYQVCHKHAGM